MHCIVPQRQRTVRVFLRKSCLNIQSEGTCRGHQAELPELQGSLRHITAGIIQTAPDRCQDGARTASPGSCSVFDHPHNTQRSRPPEPPAPALRHLLTLCHPHRGAQSRAPPRDSGRPPDPHTGQPEAFRPHGTPPIPSPVSLHQVFSLLFGPPFNRPHSHPLPPPLPAPPRSRPPSPALPPQPLTARLPRTPRPANMALALVAERCRRCLRALQRP